MFDAAAALCGIGRYVNYEGQAAVELEQVLDKNEAGAYDFTIEENEGKYILDWRPLIRQMVEDINKGVPQGILSARFHNSIISISEKICLILRDATGINTIVLSGGCWQNKYLLQNCVEKLSKHNFDVYFNNQVPINDGGTAYGQSAVVAAMIKGGK